MNGRGMGQFPGFGGNGPTFPGQGGNGQFPGFGGNGFPGFGGNGAPGRPRLTAAAGRSLQACRRDRARWNDARRPGRADAPVARALYSSLSSRGGSRRGLVPFSCASLWA
jgi:hypothetical protein